MAQPQRSDYIVIKRSIMYRPCKYCNSTGTVTRTFRKTTFVEQCLKCNGTGKTKNVINEEVPLIEALKELSIIK